MGPDQLAAVLRDQLGVWVRSVGTIGDDGWPEIPENQPGPMSRDASQEIARMPGRQRKRDNDEE